MLVLESYQIMLIFIYFIDTQKHLYYGYIEHIGKEV